MSFNVATLQALEAEGLDLAACIRVLSTVEPKPDTAAEKRRAWDRDRKAEKRAEAKSGGTSGGSPPDPTPNERNNLTPTRERKPKPNGLVKNAVKGFRLPADWQPATLTGKAATMVATWQAGAMERELAKFKNYWLAKGANAARTDWQRTWVNWLISADERKPRGTYERSDRDPTTVAVERYLRGDVGTHAGTG